MFSFLRERVYLRGAKSSRKMLVRIQYVLFVLLFVLAGSLGGARPQGGACGMQPGLIRQSTLRAPVPVHNYVAATVISCEASIENPGQSSSQKAVVRPRCDLRSAASVAVAPRSPARSGSCVLHPRPVDYYIFSLGRILI